EGIMTRVDVELFRKRTVDNHERRYRMCRGLNAVEIERLLTHRLDREHDEREVLRAAARHDCVRRQTQRRGGAVARRYRRDRLVPRAIAVFEHILYALRSGRHDRQTVAPSAFTA